jgi:hypothetical protein
VLVEVRGYANGKRFTIPWPIRTERCTASRHNRPRQKPAPIRCRSRKAIGEGLSQLLQGWASRHCPAFPSVTRVEPRCYRCTPTIASNLALTRLARLISSFPSRIAASRCRPPLNILRGISICFARSRTLRRIPAEPGLQFHQIGENVGLAPQLVGDHRRLA